jgi:hypothetical protein
MDFILFIHLCIGRGEEAWNKHIGVGFETWATCKALPNSFPSTDNRINHIGHHYIQNVVKTHDYTSSRVRVLRNIHKT